MTVEFINSYACLPAEFYTKLHPTPVDKPRLFQFNQSLAKTLGLPELSSDEQATDYFAGNRILEGSDPLAMVYAGHQFGGFSNQLGDGRAILLGEVKGIDSIRYDIQLKGSGPTPYSRGGDGRSALGPVIREYLVSEAMAKLGVPTTRALAAVTTGEEVARMSLVPSGILTRVSTGFVRVGTFEYFSARRNLEAIKQLADYEIERHYPKIKGSENIYLNFLAEVTKNQAHLIAQWMCLGFIHGVMNTDNMSIAGETIDYGPCAFMDDFTFDRVYSSIDRNGRYAYNNQPQIGQWNLIRLAETLLPLIAKGDTEEDGKLAVEEAQEILKSYQEAYLEAWANGMREKLGLTKAHENDDELASELLDVMADCGADFTLSYYELSKVNCKNTDNDEAFLTLFSKRDEAIAWLKKWRARLEKEQASEAQHRSLMQTSNPLYIPRNHQVEAAIRAAEDNNDFSVFYELHEVLQNPYEYQMGKENYALPPRPEQVVHQTFCGT